MTTDGVFRQRSPNPIFFYKKTVRINLSRGPLIPSQADIKTTGGFSLYLMPAATSAEVAVYVLKKFRTLKGRKGQVDIKRRFLST